MRARDNEGEGDYVLEGDNWMMDVARRVRDGTVGAGRPPPASSCCRSKWRRDRAQVASAEDCPGVKLGIGSGQSVCC